MSINFNQIAIISSLSNETFIINYPTNTCLNIDDYNFEVIRITSIIEEYERLGNSLEKFRGPQKFNIVSFDLAEFDQEFRNGFIQMPDEIV